MLCDRSLSFFHSFCHSINKITDERGNERRPNLAGTGKRWPCRSGWLLVVMRICAWIPVFHFLHHWGISDFPTFVSISLFSQFSYNQQPIWINSRFEPNLAKWMTPTSVAYPQFWRTSGSRLIRKSEFKPDHFFFKFWRRRRFALSITNKTSLISKTPSLVRAIAYRCSIENGISCFSGVILSPYNCS